MEMVCEAGVELMLHTYLADVVTEDNKVKGVVVENKSGRSTYYADVIIDATGDADVAVRAGACLLYTS